jgi:hypothetical protein
MKIQTQGASKVVKRNASVAAMAHVPRMPSNVSGKTSITNISIENVISRVSNANLHGFMIHRDAIGNSLSTNMVFNSFVERYSRRFR